MKRRMLELDENDRGRTVPEVLVRHLACPLDQAQQLVEAGAVYVQGRRVGAGGLRLRGDERVTVVLEERGRTVLAPRQGPPPLQVVYEDDAVLAVDKPPFVDAQPSPGRVGESLLDAASAHLGRPAGLVHRLDRQTSGVTLFGKSPAATTALARQFREGTVKKRYLAVCGTALTAHGKGGVVDLPLSKDPSRPGRFRASRTANGVPASTAWDLLHVAPSYVLVVLHPRTGRTHQLRAHLTGLGAPILGDVRYGGVSELDGEELPRCLLHAQALAVRHPVTFAPLLLEAPVPEDLQRFFRRAGVEPPQGAVQEKSFSTP